MAQASRRIRCREIEAADIDAVVGVLKEGFPNHGPDYWAQALERLTAHGGVPGRPKYGYLLEADGRIVGVLLVIFAAVASGAQTIVRANIASWYVESSYRSSAAMLTSRAHAHPGTTFLQLTPSPHVVPIVEAQGYRRYALGMFAAITLLCARVPGARVRAVTADLRAGDDLTRADCELLLDHQSYDCISLTCTLAGRRHPFVFARRWRRTRIGWLPFARLIYCRSLDDFVRFAGPLGRYLAFRGIPMILLDANASLPGIPGRFLNESARFFKGPETPRLGDLAYTELSMFGL